MNAYRPFRFHAGAGIAAAAMMTLTLVIAVVLPMHIATAGPDSALPTVPAGAADAVTAVVTLPRIEVIGKRDTTLANDRSQPKG
jgi:Mg2+/Co2+ transporter CorB